MRKIFFGVAAVIAVIGQAFAQTPATTPPTAAQATPTDAATDTSYLDRVVCKKYPPLTGTRLGSRNVCRTERDWREMTRRSQEDITKRQTFHVSLPGE